MSNSSADSLGDSPLASTRPSSPPTVTSPDRGDMSRMEVDAAQEPAAQDKNVEEDDEEGMDVKAKALTNLLKTSSVSFYFVVTIR